MEIEQATTQEVFEPTIEDMIQTESGIPTTTALVISILSYTNIPRT